MYYWKNSHFFKRKAVGFATASPAIQLVDAALDHNPYCKCAKKDRLQKPGWNPLSKPKKKWRKRQWLLPGCRYRTAFLLGEAEAASRVEPHIDGVATLAGAGRLLELEGQYAGLSRLNGAVSQGSFPAGTEACRRSRQVR